MTNTVSMPKKIKSFISNNPVIYRYISYLLSSIIISILPIIMFLIFMGEKSFFSYDFFTQGLFGMKIFFLFSLIIILLLIGMMFAFIAPLIKVLYLKQDIKLLNLKKHNKKVKEKKYTKQKAIINKKLKSAKSYIKWLLFFNLINILIFFLSFYLKQKLGLFYFLAFLGLCISIHVSILLHGKVSHQFYSLLFLVTLILFFIIYQSKHTAEIIDIGLRKFGVGGEIEIIIQPKFNDKKKVLGKLVLMSPNRIFYKKVNSPFISIIERSRYDITTIFRNFNDEELDNKK